MERAFCRRRARWRGAWPPNLGLLKVGLLGLLLNEMGVLGLLLNEMDFAGFAGFVFK